MTGTRDEQEAVHAAHLRLEEETEVWRLLLGCYRAGHATLAEVEAAAQQVYSAWDRFARAAGLSALGAAGSPGRRSPLAP